MSNVGLFKAEVDAARKAIGVVADSVKNLKQSPLLKTALNEGEVVMPDITGEATSNVMIAYRHLEDARMRLGKAIQAVDGGVSCYDNRPKIIAICGSTRFIDQIAKYAWDCEKQGIIALAPMLLPASVAVASDHCAEVEGVKDIVDATFLKKIEMADEVFVVNVGGYIGESTRAEIEHAKKLGKPLDYLESVTDKPPILLPGGPQITPRPTIEELEKMIARGQKFEMNPDGTVSQIPSDTGPTAAQANEILGKPGHY